MQSAGFVQRESPRTESEKLLGKTGAGESYDVTLGIEI